MREREAYLEALGLTPWVLRDREAGDAVDPVISEGEDVKPPEPPASAPDRAMAEVPAPPVQAPADRVETGRRARVRLGPGTGSCLFLCGPADDEAAPLASDLARVPADAPVWAKLTDGDEGSLLEGAIAERLFTQVVVFGEAAARLVFGDDIPEACGPARVTVVDDLSRLGRDAGARKACWVAMKTAGVAQGS
jgi:hypothetical protein